MFHRRAHFHRVLFISATLLAACGSDPASDGGGRGGSVSGSGGRGGAGVGGASTGGTGGSGVTVGTGGAVGTGGTTATGGAGAPGSGGAAGGAAGSGGNSGSDGGPIADASPDTAADMSAPVGTGPMVLTSSVFAEGQDIARKYRCRTENVSPPLSWTPGPAGTLSYAVTMYHMQRVHWMLWDVPATTTSLPEGIARLAEPPLPAGSKQMKPNVDGSTWYGYSGPCPGSPNRRYDYFVYALEVAKLPGVTPESTVTQIDAALQANRLSRAQLTGTGSP